MPKQWYYCQHCVRCFQSNGNTHSCIKTIDKKEKSVNIKIIKKQRYKIYTKNNTDTFGDCSQHNHKSIPYCIVLVSDYQSTLKEEIIKYNIQFPPNEVAQSMEIDSTNSNKEVKSLCKQVK